MASLPPAASLIARLLELLGAWQVRRPLLVMALVLSTLLPAGLLASRLGVRENFSELLPEDKPSVIEMRRIEKRLASRSTLIVVIEGGDVAALKRFVDALAPRLRAALDPTVVTDVETGTREVQEFFEHNKHLYVSLERLRELHGDVLGAYDSAVARASGLDLGLDDEVEEPEPVFDLSVTEQKLTAEADAARKRQPGLDGYYIGGAPQTLAAVLVRTPLGSTDPRAFELRAQIDGIVRQLQAAGQGAGLRVGYTGNLITSAEQRAAVLNDLRDVGFWGVTLILGVTLLFFLRLRVVLLMALTVATGALWTFGLVRLTIGHLNSATGFLVSIIVGNGINFGIIYMARYIEARREQQLAVAPSVAVAHRETYGGTMAAAAAAMIAYGSLSATDFRGFRHFGVIGGMGMILCWLATYLLMPPLLVLSERAKPLFVNEAPWRARLRGVYGYPFAWLAMRAPRLLVALGLVSGVACAVLGVRYFLSDPMQYDLRKIRNDQLSPTSAGELAARVDPVVGRLGQDGRAIVVDRVDQVQPLVAELVRRREAAPAGNKPFSKVVSIFDLLPKDQDEKLTLLADINQRVERARKRGLLSEAEYRRIREYVPEKPVAIGIQDLPAAIVRPFTESDGERGKIVYIAPTEKRSIWDFRYLTQWADSFREVKLPSGDVIRGTGDPVILADMLINVREDAPKAVLLSLGGTLLVMLGAFRFGKDGFIGLATLLLGLSWLAGFLALRGVKLNFLNFVALPISIGIGADYALNVLKRREVSGDEQLYRIVVETGGAVILCSLTTTLGYLALLLSINGAVRSFGLVAAVGEVTTLLAGVLVLPAYLTLRARRRRNAAAPAQD